MIAISKKKIIIIAVVIVVVVAVAGTYFLMSGLFKPPVDISGVSPSADLTTVQLVPSTLIGKQLTSNYTDIRYLDGTPVEYTIAKYDEVTVLIYKAPSQTDASETLDAIYDEITGATSRTKTSDWFTAESAAKSMFCWKSGIWVFAVLAENSETRNQAATELVQHLRGL